MFKEPLEQKKIKLILGSKPEGDETAIKLLEARGVRLNSEIYQQILYNIFVNACKFNVDNGSIEVTVIARFNKQDNPNSLNSEGKPGE